MAWRHVTRTGFTHWKVLERAVGYVGTTKGTGITYRKPKSLRSISYADSNYATNVDNRRSITGNINTLGGMLTNWCSKTQQSVTLSSTEAEYIALVNAAQEMIFTQMLLSEVDRSDEPGIIFVDNTGAIFLVRNAQVSGRTKHIDVRHHFIRDLQHGVDGDDKKVKLQVRFVVSEDNHSDGMTKNLVEGLFLKHAKAMKEGKLECWREDVGKE